MKCTNTPSIVKCDVLQCAYNINQQCHTPAITVGSMCPKCESFTKGLDKGGDVNVSGSVGSCHESDCKFNQSLECSSPGGISVGSHMWHADCKTYSKR
jgi:hypothetical protein